MITIQVGELTYEFDNYEDAKDFVKCLSRDETYEINHEHRFNHCTANGMNFCICGKVEE